MKETRPDLPALEEVCLKTHQILSVLCMLISMTLFISGIAIYGYLKYKVYFSDMLLLVQTVIGIILFLSLWMIFRLLSADYIWKTDSYGLHINGIFRKKSIKWINVTDVIPVKTLTSGTVYKLKTHDKVITLAPLTTSHILIASVWQHLRRYGKADSIQLNDEILSLWAEIPYIVPTEMQWTNPRPTKLSLVVISFIFFAIILIYFLVIAILSGKNSMLVMAMIFIPSYVLIFKLIYKEPFLRSNSVSINNEYIDVKLPLRTVQLPWSDVVSAKWEKISKGGDNHLQIKGMDSKTEVLIPHVIEDEESSKLILAIIRKLRTAGVPQALVIPAILRYQKATPVSELVGNAARMNGFVELRFLWWERLICAIPFVALIGVPVSLFLTHRSEFPPQAFATLLLSFIAGFTIVGAYSMRVDDEGISKKFLWWSKTVRWSDVDSLVITESRNNSRFLKRFLKGNSGKVLIGITMEFGGMHNYENFIAFLNMKLAEHLPADKINTLWKAG